MKQNGLFNEPQLRRKDGRYCTKEQYRVEKIENENTRLRLERDKYFRMYLALAKDNERLNRELIVLKSKISNLL